MTITDWLFADDDARVAQARVALDERRFDDARALLSGVAGDAAELLRDELIEHYDDEPTPHEPPIDPAERTLDLEHISITEACPLLKPQLFPTATAAEQFESSQVLSYAPADGLTAVLMYDLGYRAEPVLAKTAVMWGPTESQLFDFATKNIVANEVTDVLDVSWEGAFLCDMITGSRPFVGALALGARDVLTESVDHALIAVPSDHCFLFRSLHSPADRRVLEPFCAFVQHAFGEADAPVTPAVYWWRHNQWTEVPYTRDDDDGVIVDLPAGFCDMLAELADD